MIGPNGAGKSTVFKAIVGLLAIHSGRILLDGQDVTRQTPAQMIAHGVTCVPQGRNVVPDLSVLHNLELGGITARDQARVRRRIDEVVTRFPILRAKQRQPAIALSGGRQKQLEIARALLLDPKLILIDEPSATGASPSSWSSRTPRPCSPSPTWASSSSSARPGCRTAPALLADPRVGQLLLGGSIEKSVA